jgi:tryptophan synthase alpha chain
MKRIEETFRALKVKKEKALIVYLTAGDPTLLKTEELILALDRAGVDIVEVGVPFSDPTADGPIIQAAAKRSLDGGANLPDIIRMIKRIRRVSEIPIVLFGYYNPIFIYGNEQFARKAKEAGVDGILVVDLPPEESAELRRYTDKAGIDYISLIAPTSGGKRIGEIAGKASGFLYYISITGVTGTATPQAENVRTAVERIRKLTTLPVVVGFGISTPRQAAEIAPHADGVVIGSAFVRMIAEAGNAKDLVPGICRYAADIKRALKRRQTHGNG